MTEDVQLLRSYVATGSEPAFRELVDRHLDLVYSLAVRVTEGDHALAQDIAQQVFTDLARDARRVAGRFVLGGWLYRHACFTAAKTMRAERRRRAREQAAVAMNPHDATPAEAAWEQLAPVLDQAMSQLSPADRDALVLRFFQNRDLRQVGAAIGVTDDTAQKRVSRALERLRLLLRRHGVSSSAGALAALLGAHGAAAAPAGLAAAISSASLAATAATVAAGAGSLFTFYHLLFMTKLKLAVGAVVLAALGTTLLLQYQAQAWLRTENQRLRQQLAQGAPADPGPGVANPGADPASGSSASDQAAELTRLRDQVGALRQQTGALNRAQAENHRLHAAANEPEDPVAAEFQKETERRMGDFKQWALLFITHAMSHRERLPERWDQVAHQIDPGVRDAFLSFATNHYEIVYTGTPTLHGLSRQPGQELLLREKQARRSPKGEWIKVYCFADGHAEAHSEPDGNFDTWEQQHWPHPK